MKKNLHFIIPPCIRRPRYRGFPSEYRHPLWYGKTRMVSLPDGKKNSKICLFVLTWSTTVTDRRTDRRTDTAWQQRPRLCIASRGKNRNKKLNSRWDRQTLRADSNYRLIPVTFTYLIGESRLFLLKRLINTLTYLLTYLLMSVLLMSVLWRNTCQPCSAN